MRPLPSGDADPATADKEALGPDGEKVHTHFEYGPADATRAPNYNRWPAGLENLAGYTASMTKEQLVKQLVERPTTYLLGQVDVLPLGGFDSSPNAMAQGTTRRARGEAFFKYVTETLGAKHNAIIVPECGHNDRCIFTSNIVFPVIFPQLVGWWVGGLVCWWAYGLGRSLMMVQDTPNRSRSMLKRVA